MTKRQADLALLLATALWGTSFVAVKRALADATPLAFLALRFGIAALLLAPATRFRPLPGAREWRGGLLLGALVAAGFVTQTVGLVTTTPSRSAFIVAVSSILAPVIALALLGRRPAWPVAAALAVAFASTVCFLLQMRAQRHMSPARAALIFCFEPLFAALTSWLVLGERLSFGQWTGGALILAGMVLAELPAAAGAARAAPARDAP